MTRTEAAAQVFWLAFRGLAEKEQSAVLEKLVADEELCQDLLDLATIHERRSEPERPLREYHRLLRSAL